MRLEGALGSSIVSIFTVIVDAVGRTARDQGDADGLVAKH
jgi:hypothetical protein